MKIGHYNIRVKGHALFVPILFTAILIYYVVDSWSIINTDSMLTIRAVAILMLLSLAFIIKREVVIQKTDSDASDKQDPFLSSREDYVKFFGFALLSFLYISAFIYAGFIIATLVFPIVTMYFLGVRNVKILLLVPALSTIVIYIIFKLILGVSLPSGVLSI